MDTTKILETLLAAREVNIEMSRKNRDTNAGRLEAMDLGRADGLAYAIDLILDGKYLDKQHEFLTT